MFPETLLSKWLARLGGATEQKHGDASRTSPANPAVEAGSTADVRLQVALEDNRRLVLALKALRHSSGNQLALLSALLARQSRTSDDPECGGRCRSQQLRVHAVANAMRADISGDTSEFVSSKTFVDGAVEGLLELASDAGVEIEVDVQDFRLQRDDAFSYMLIINELAVNSLKHAFPNAMGGDIRDSLRARTRRRSARARGRGQRRWSNWGCGSRRAWRDGDRIGGAGARRETVEEYCWADGERRGLRTTISQSRIHARPSAPLTGSVGAAIRAERCPSSARESRGLSSSRRWSWNRKNPARRRYDQVLIVCTSDRPKRVGQMRPRQRKEERRCLP